MKNIVIFSFLIALISCSSNTSEEFSSSSFGFEESSSSKGNSSSVNYNPVSSSSYDNCVAGISGNILTDSRDCKKYKIVKIGDLTWMAENLNYEYLLGYMSECFDEDDSNCEKYGRLYKWDTWGELCPQDWHLPTLEDWENLVYATGDLHTAGKKLKSTTGWNENGNGTDEFGFTALPGGSGNVWLIGEVGFWWSSVSESANHPFAYAMRFYYFSDAFEFRNNSKSNMSSVRCVKNKPPLH
jgi:uncharacterized protein (TIGR02145 family)